MFIFHICQIWTWYTEFTAQFCIIISTHNGEIEDNVCTGAANCLCTHRSVILVFVSLDVSQNSGNKHQNNTLSYVHKQFVMTVYTLFYFLHDIIKTILTHRLHVVLALCLCSAHDDLLLMMSQCNNVSRQLCRKHMKRDILLIRYWFYSWILCKKINEQNL